MFTGKKKKKQKRSRNIQDVETSKTNKQQKLPVYNTRKRKKGKNIYIV